MLTLAFIEGLFSPSHILILLFLLAVPTGIVFLVVILTRQSTQSSSTPTDADLARRRQALELDRMVIENEERRRKLEQP